MDISLGRHFATVSPDKTEDLVHVNSNESWRLDFALNAFKEIKYLVSWFLDNYNLCSVNNNNLNS